MPRLFRPSIQRIHALPHQELAHNDGIGAIEAQGLNSGPASRGPAYEPRAIPCEVFGPNVLARMEEPNDLSCIRVNSREVRSFVAVAKAAGQRQVGQIIR